MSYVRAFARVAPIVLAAIACGSTDDAAETEPAIEENVTTRAGGYRLTGVAPKASGGFPSVVELFPVSREPEPGAPPEPEVQESESEPEPVLMDQYGNEFHPPVLIVRTGEQVSFKNSEDVLHNVRVVGRETRETIFNVGTPVVGSYEHRFESPGVYDVSCQIHPSMAAFLVVTDAEFAVVAAGGGEFTFEGVPAGDYVVEVWNLDPSRQLERRVTLDSDTTLDLTRKEGGAE